MSTNNNSGNFWLQVKKEYIDENLDALISYLSKCTKNDRDNHDYELTINALSDRVNDILEELVQTPLFTDTINNDCLSKYTRLMIAHLIVCQENELVDTEAFAGLCSLLIRTGQTPSYDTCDKLRKLCIDCVKNTEIDTLKVTWSDIKDISKFYPQVIAQKIADTTLKINDSDTILYYQNKGCIVARGDDARLAALNFKDFRQHKKLVDVIPSPCGLSIVGNDSESLSQSAATNITKTDTAHWQIVRQMESVRPSAAIANKKSKRYNIGDIVVAKVIQANNNVFNVETVDPRYEQIKGQVFIDTAILGISKSEILDFIFEKHYHEREFLITVEVQDKPHYPFILRNVLFDFYKILAEESNGAEMLAFCYDKYSLGHKWLTENGISLNIMDDEAEEDIFEQFDNVIVHETKIDGAKCIINGKLSDNCYNDEEFEPDEFKKTAHRNFLEKFLNNASIPVAAEVETIEELSPNILSFCVCGLYHTATKCEETRIRHLMLSLAHMLCTLIGDKQNADFLRFEIKYLMSLIEFAHGGKFKNEFDLKVEEAFSNVPSVQEKMMIISTLNNYNFELLKMKKEPELVRTRTVDVENIKKLVEASQTLNGVIPLREIDAIKHTIAKNLFVDDEYESIVDEESEFGEEDEIKEFKTSIVFDPSKTDQPNLKRQMKNILNAVCGFLNTEKGGDLYIGVNDSGEAIGVEHDIQQLFIMKVISEVSIDKYRLFIENSIENAFKDASGPESGRDITGLFVSTHIEQSERKGTKFLRISIKPYEYGVVEFIENLDWEKDDSKSFIRKSGRTIKMTEMQKEQLLERRKKGKNINWQKIQIIKKGMAEKKCITLFNYESSSGISNRTIEAYYFKASINAIMAFDTLRGENREFKINRFEYAKIEDSKWAHEKKHLKNPRTDIFHIMESEKQKGLKVVLEFDNYVKNLLIEEYPDAKRLEDNPLTGERLRKENETGKWRLETTIYGFSGITRFYLGLAKRIKIIEGKQLKEHILNYINSIQI